MVYTPKMKRLYERIQDKLYYMIPEKWDKLYLYASVLEQMQDILSGEMYFYYFPKGILKKNHINVYEIPSKFNIGEETYSRQLKELYETIKELWREFVALEHRPWYSITLSIENFKFRIEYNYTDISLLPYSPEQRHIIWMYKNFKKDIDSYARKERKWLEDYLEDGEEEDIDVHEHSIYKNSKHNVIQYKKEEVIEVEAEEPDIVVNNEILLKRY